MPYHEGIGYAIALPTIMRADSNFLSLATYLTECSVQITWRGCTNNALSYGNNLVIIFLCMHLIPPQVHTLNNQSLTVLSM